MRKLLIPVLSAVLVAGVVYGDAIIPRQRISIPQMLGTLNDLIADLNNKLPGINFSWSTGDQTAIVTGMAGFTKVPRPTSIDNITASAQSATCSDDPGVTVYECGTSTTCQTPTTIATVTLTSIAAGTAYPATIVNPQINAGDYIAFATSGGTCSASNISVNVMGH